MQNIVMSVLFTPVPAIVPIAIGFVGIGIYCYSKGAMDSLKLNNSIRLGSK